MTTEGAAPPGHRRRLTRKRLGCGCLSALVALVFGLVLLEWYLRGNVGHLLGPAAEAQGMYRLDELDRVVPTPGWRGTLTIEGRPTAVCLDELGFRSSEPVRGHAGEPPGTRRVIVLGDSLVFGYGVSAEEAFPAVLEKLLAESSDAPVRVANAGIPGIGTTEQVAILDRARDRFPPDVVLSCLYLGNDFVDDAVIYKTVVSGYMLGGPMGRAAAESWRMQLALRFRTAFVIEKFLLENVPALALDFVHASPEDAAATALLPPGKQRDLGFFADSVQESELIRQILGRCAESWRRLQELADPAPVVAVIVPTWWHVLAYEDTLRELGLDPEQHRRGTIQRRLQALGDEIGMEVWDLTPVLDASEDQAGDWLPQDKHLSAAGCKRVAEWLAPRVRELLQH